MFDGFLHTMPSLIFCRCQIELKCLVFCHVTKEDLIIRKLKSNLWVGDLMMKFGAFQCLKTRDEWAKTLLKWASRVL